MKKSLTAAFITLLLSACYESPSDLLGVNANTFTKLDPIFSLKGQVYYFEGNGRTAEVCGLGIKADMKTPCKSAGSMSLERTSRGNYIVQLKGKLNYDYGLWFRSDGGPQGKSGLQCFVWLGDGIVGRTDMSSVWLQWGRSEVFSKLAPAVRQVATEKNINRQQLLKIASIYEDVLSPLGSESVTCIGDRIWILTESAAINGDNRHLREFEPGPSIPR